MSDIEVGDYVLYFGTSRGQFKGIPFPVTAVSENGRSAEFDAGIYGKQWCAVGSLEKVKIKPAEPANVARYGMSTDGLDEAFTKAEGGHREQLKAEIERVRIRLAELESALQVIDSL